MSAATARPNPGSQEAHDQGCTCPRLDNAYGRGHYCSGLFVMRDDCPLHGSGAQMLTPAEPDWCDECYEETRPCACERYAADFAGRAYTTPCQSRTGLYAGNRCSQPTPTHELALADGEVPW